MPDDPSDVRPERARRPRYAGRNPRAFHHKYKELNAAAYPADVQKVLDSGKTPAGTHRPIMVAEVLECLRPEPGDIAVDGTLGGGGHARAILERIRPNGRLIGLDVDPLELPRTEAQLRAAGFGPETFTACRGNFAGLPQVLAAEGLDAVNVVVADLGVSSMQLDNPDRGFSYKEPGPLDMRMNPTRGEPAWQLLARVPEHVLASLLEENADEPHAQLIARLLKERPLETTHAVERIVRTGLNAARPDLSKPDVKRSVRRTFQALRIAVNDEFSSLEALLRVLPQCLAPGGRVAILTFHSGEDRRVKKAFKEGQRAGVYSEIADRVVQATMEETRANRRASAAKLRWAVRSARMRVTGAMLIAALATACGSLQPSAPASPSPAVLAEVDAAVSAMREERRTPGLALVVLQGDESVLARGYGITDESTGNAVSETTVFQLGSISKQFLAALALRLAEQGRVSLDAPVVQHLPEFTRLLPELQVRDLLNHTAGIRELFSIPEYLQGIDDLRRRAEELPRILRGAPVEASPRTRWSYSNSNYAILALLVERITGTPYEDLLSTEFFRPLGLSSLRQCPSMPGSDGDALGHVLRDGGVLPSAPENMHWIRGDGGLCGHAVDVARWTRLLAAGRVVTPESYQAMSAPTRLDDGSLADYGFGLSLVTLDGRRKVAHNGAMLGFSASAAYYPDDELTVVVLANLGDVRTESIERQIARRLLSMAPPDLRARALPPEVKRRVVGRYDIGVFPVHVSERGEHLWLEMPTPGPTTPLRYVGAGEFVCESDPDACRLTFSEETPAATARLYMGAMHWYGVRMP